MSYLVVGERVRVLGSGAGNNGQYGVVSKISELLDVKCFVTITSGSCVGESYWFKEESLVSLKNEELVDDFENYSNCKGNGSSNQHFEQYIVIEHTGCDTDCEIFTNKEEAKEHIEFECVNFGKGLRNFDLFYQYGDTTVIKLTVENINVDSKETENNEEPPYPKDLMAEIKDAEEMGNETFITNSMDEAIFIIKNNNLGKWVTINSWCSIDEEPQAININDKAFDRLYKVMTEIKEETDE